MNGLDVSNFGLVIFFVLAILLFLFGQMIHLSVVLSWGDEKTRGLEYYGLPPAERRRFKGKLCRQARLLFPVLRLMGRFSGFTFEKASFRHRDRLNEVSVIRI